MTEEPLNKKPPLPAPLEPPSQEIMAQWQAFAARYHEAYRDNALQLKRGKIAPRHAKWFGNPHITLTEDEEKNALAESTVNANLFADILFSGRPAADVLARHLIEYMSKHKGDGVLNEKTVHHKLSEGLSNIARYMGHESIDEGAERTFHHAMLKRLMNKWVHHENAHELYGLKLMGGRTSEAREFSRKHKRKYREFLELPESMILSKTVHNLCFYVGEHLVRPLIRPHRKYEFIREHERILFEKAMRTYVYFEDETQPGVYDKTGFITHYTNTVGSSLAAEVRSGERPDVAQSPGEYGAVGEKSLFDRADERTEDPADKPEKQEMLDRLPLILSKLNPRERNIIIRRFGLDGKEALSLNDAGKEEGITLEGARKAQNAALEKLYYYIDDVMPKDGFNQPAYLALKDQLIELVNPYSKKGLDLMKVIKQSGCSDSKTRLALTSLLTTVENPSSYAPIPEHFSLDVRRAIRNVISERSTDDDRETRLKAFEEIFDGMRQISYAAHGIHDPLSSADAVTEQPGKHTPEPTDFLAPVGPVTQEMLQKWHAFVERYKENYLERAWQKKKNKEDRNSRVWGDVPVTLNDEEMQEARKEIVGNVRLFKDIVFSDYKLDVILAMHTNRYIDRNKEYGDIKTNYAHYRMFEGLTDIARYMGQESIVDGSERYFHHKVLERLMNKWVHHERDHEMYGMRLRSHFTDKDKEITEFNKTRKKQYRAFFNRQESGLITKAVHGLCYYICQRYIAYLQKVHGKEAPIREIEHILFENAMRTFTGKAGFTTYYERTVNPRLGAMLGNRNEIKNIESLGEFGDPDDVKSLLQNRADERAEDPAYRAEIKEMIEQLNAVLPELEQRKLEIIQYRFIDGMTLDEIGKIYGITREAVRQMEEKALDELRFRIEEKAPEEGFNQATYHALRNQLIKLVHPFEPGRKRILDLNKVQEEAGLPDKMALYALLIPVENPSPTASSLDHFAFEIKRGLRRVIDHRSTDKNRDARLAAFEEIFDGMHRIAKDAKITRESRGR